MHFISFPSRPIPANTLLDAFPLFDKEIAPESIRSLDDWYIAFFSAMALARTSYDSRILTEEPRTSSKPAALGYLPSFDRTQVLNWQQWTLCNSKHAYRKGYLSPNKIDIDKTKAVLSTGGYAVFTGRFETYRYSSPGLLAKVNIAEYWDAAYGIKSTSGISSWSGSSFSINSTASGQFYLNTFSVGVAYFGEFSWGVAAVTGRTADISTLSNIEKYNPRADGVCTWAGAMYAKQTTPDGKVLKSDMFVFKRGVDFFSQNTFSWYAVIYLDLEDSLRKLPGFQCVSISI